MTVKIPYNFGGLAKEFTDYSRAKIAILPVPFDNTSTWQKGADQGPRAIINASGNMELYDIASRSEVYQQGIFTARPIIAKTPELMVKKTYAAVKKLLADNKFIVTLGGEHSIALGPLKAHLEKFENLSVLHLDAHADRREIYDHSRYNHACVIARVQELTQQVYSVGVRSLDSTERKNIDWRKIYLAQDIYNQRAWIKKLVKQLSANVYLTFDLDVFDPSIMPATGTPEPGGLDWYLVLELLHAVIKNKNLVGADVVELCPTLRSPASDFLAAKLIYQILTYKFIK